MNNYFENVWHVVEDTFSDVATTVGNILQLTSSSCDLTPMLFVKALNPAGVKFFKSMNRPDWKHFYHLVNGQSFVCSVKGALLDSEVLDAESESGLTRFLFRTAEGTDMGLWYMFLASVAGEYTLNYTSQLLKLSSCDPTSRTWSSDKPYQGIYGTGEWGGFDWYIDVGPFSPANAGSILAPQGGSAYIFGTAEGQYFDAAGPHIIGLGTRILNSTSGQVMDYQFPSLNPNTGKFESGIAGTEQNNFSDFLGTEYSLQFSGTSPTGITIVPASGHASAGSNIAPHVNTQKYQGPDASHITTRKNPLWHQIREAFNFN